MLEITLLIAAFSLLGELILRQAQSFNQQLSNINVTRHYRVRLQTKKDRVQLMNGKDKTLIKHTIVLSDGIVVVKDLEGKLVLAAKPVGGDYWFTLMQTGTPFPVEMPWVLSNKKVIVSPQLDNKTLMIISYNAVDMVKIKRTGLMYYGNKGDNTSIVFGMSMAEIFEKQQDHNANGFEKRFRRTMAFTLIKNVGSRFCSGGAYAKDADFYNSTKHSQEGRVLITNTYANSILGIKADDKRFMKGEMQFEAWLPYNAKYIFIKGKCQVVDGVLYDDDTGKEITAGIKILGLGKNAKALVATAMKRPFISIKWYRGQDTASFSFMSLLTIFNGVYEAAETDIKTRIEIMGSKTFIECLKLFNSEDGALIEDLAKIADKEVCDFLAATKVKSQLNSWLRDEQINNMRLANSCKGQFVVLQTKEQRLECSAAGYSWFVSQDKVCKDSNGNRLIPILINKHGNIKYVRECDVAYLEKKLGSLDFDDNGDSVMTHIGSNGVYRGFTFRYPTSIRGAVKGLYWNDSALRFSLYPTITLITDEDILLLDDTPTQVAYTNSELVKYHMVAFDEKMAKPIFTAKNYIETVIKIVIESFGSVSIVKKALERALLDKQVPEHYIEEARIVGGSDDSDLLDNSVGKFIPIWNRLNGSTTGSADYMMIFEKVVKAMNAGTIPIPDFMEARLQKLTPSAKTYKTDILASRAKLVKLVEEWDILVNTKFDLARERAKLALGSVVPNSYQYTGKYLDQKYGQAKAYLDEIDIRIEALLIEDPENPDTAAITELEAGKFSLSKYCVSIEDELMRNLIPVRSSKLTDAQNDANEQAFMQSIGYDILVACANSSSGSTRCGQDTFFYHAVGGVIRSNCNGLMVLKGYNFPLVKREDGSLAICQVGVKGSLSNVLDDRGNRIPKGDGFIHQQKAEAYYQTKPDKMLKATWTVDALAWFEDHELGVMKGDRILYKNFLYARAVEHDTFYTSTVADYKAILDSLTVGESEK